ncbi:hypothetical protein V8C35DRAFT_328177 [Trichoderma chlorosporum]
MFTRPERDNYNETGNAIYQDMRLVFRRTVHNGGCVKPPKDFTSSELAWVNTFESIPAHLAKTFKRDIHQMNIEARQLYKEYMETFPELFEDVECSKDILRLTFTVDSSINWALRPSAFYTVGHRFIEVNLADVFKQNYVSLD